jgi:uncharacterized phage protein (TIGR01671 family)
MNNRVIKFRVWDNKYKNWMVTNFGTIHGISNFISKGGKGYKLEEILKNETVTKKVHEEIPFNGKHPRWILQQYTGLKDKNNKEIYEGDIVSVLDENNVFDVRFGSVKRNIMGFDTNTVYPVEISCFYFHRDGLPHFSITKNHLGKHDLKNTEVIGNIFENKQLLE